MINVNSWGILKVFEHIDQVYKIYILHTLYVKDMMLTETMKRITNKLHRFTPCNIFYYDRSINDHCSHIKLSEKQRTL